MLMGEKCRSGCVGRSHGSYAECLRSANVTARMGAVPMRGTMSELEAYRQARSEGIQPAGTSRVQVDAAKAFSDKHGAAYDASNLTGSLVSAGLAPKEVLG